MNPLPPCTCFPDTLSHACPRHGWSGVRESRGPKRTGLRAETLEKKLDRARWAGIKAAFIFLEADEKCRWCGESIWDGSEIDADHILPLGRGGKSEPGNCQLLHRRCHDEKHGVPMWSSNG